MAIPYCVVANKVSNYIAEEADALWQRNKYGCSGCTPSPGLNKTCLICAKVLPDA